VEPLLVRAARREPVEHTPVWFMRQAGRSLPEYRLLRERHAFFEINRSAELTAEVTLQPVRRHDVDAAVIFADVITPAAALGIDVELVEGVGPVVAEPIRSQAAVEELSRRRLSGSVEPILEAIGLVRRELRRDQAVVGFCGGPFTVAGYLVEGRPSRDFAATKSLMYREPIVWAGLLDALSDAFTEYALAQAHAGADVVQVFDSWVGALSPADYREFVAPWSARVLAALRDAGVPTIHFGTGTATLLEAMAAAGGDVIGLDWRIPLDEGWARVAPLGVQGNLDPTALLGPWARVEAGARDVLARAGGREGHIFNLGHGVLPDTDPAVLTRLRELVHEETAASKRTAPMPPPVTVPATSQKSHTSGTPA
jgi:uroporphyrinogen decarboxylase